VSRIGILGSTLFSVTVDLTTVALRKLRMKVFVASGSLSSGGRDMMCSKMTTESMSLSKASRIMNAGIGITRGMLYSLRRSLCLNQCCLLLGVSFATLSLSWL
jgi:hypothetical protein